MPLMTNAEAFQYDFGIYATELWAMTEEQFLEWLNAWCDRERPRDMVVRCKDCKHSCMDHLFGDRWCQLLGSIRVVKEDDYCSWGERKDDDVGADNSNDSNSGGSICQAEGNTDTEG